MRRRVAAVLAPLVVAVSLLTAAPALAASETCSHSYPQGIHRVSSSGVPTYHLATGFVRSTDGRIQINFTRYAWRYLGGGKYGWVPISNRSIICGVAA